ncbi:MAG TPA: hypothetical protein VHN16_06680 [Streptosporangiaceae bacterium]|nr:hypothetical protein [Streptosporangiaceae bacterium]
MAGFIAASGGGLTKGDLEALTEAPPFKLDPILRGVSGRSLQTRPPADSREPDPGRAMHVYLFVHKTLQATAENKLGRQQLTRYRDKIHGWISTYASRGWLDSKPGYAIRSYPRLLTATGDADRLLALARNPRRHVFLLRATGSRLPREG